MDWQPIETAPKDGTPILAWPINHLPGTVRFVRFENAGKMFDRWEECAGEEYAVYEPTHWMPLPEPPATLIVDPASHDRGAK